jgi:hypothetical protein
MAGKPRNISIPGNAPAAPVVEQAPIPDVVEETKQADVLAVEVAEPVATVVEQAPVARREGKAVLTAEGWVV